MSGIGSVKSDQSKGFRPVLLAYGLMASSVLSLFAGPVVALIIAGLKRNDPDTEDWLKSHCRNLQSIFVIGGVVPAIVGYIAWVLVGYGIVTTAQTGHVELPWATVTYAAWAVLVTLVTSVWSLYRFAKGIAALYDHEEV